MVLVKGGSEAKYSSFYPGPACVSSTPEPTPSPSASVVQASFVYSSLKLHQLHPRDNGLLPNPLRMLPMRNRSKPLPLQDRGAHVG